MRPHAPHITRFLSTLSVLLLALVVPPPLAHSQTCGPGACPTGFHLLDFESLSPGTSIEGLGAVDPLLNISSVAWPYSPSCTPGTAVSVEEGNLFPFGAYTSNTSVVHGCMTGIRGFADSANCVLDYDFTFAPGTSATCFSIRVLDYGDYYPYGGATHQVFLTAYDASNAVVDQDQILATGGVDLTGGDACVTQAAVGNVRLVVAGPGIVKVKLTYDRYPDPNVGYDDITFCAVSTPTQTLPRTWGRLKTTYR